MAKALLFDCVLRHGGNKEHEIPKLGVTERELLLIRAMHGDEAVPDSGVKPHVDKKTGEQASVDVDDRIELFQLARKYANTADPMSGKRVVEKVFGKALAGFDKWLEETRELEQMEQEEGMQRRNREMQERRRKELAAAAS